jgi:hypothetical protein
MTKEAGERSFDELASGLASGTLSRGRALKLMGAALVGGVLASIPGIAQADPGCKVCYAQGDTCCRRGGKNFNCCQQELNEVCCRWTDDAGLRQKSCQTVAQCNTLNGRIVKQ